MDPARFLLQDPPPTLLCERLPAQRQARMDDEYSLLMFEHCKLMPWQQQSLVQGCWERARLTVLGT